MSFAVVTAIAEAAKYHHRGRLQNISQTRIILIIIIIIMSQRTHFLQLAVAVYSIAQQ